MRLIKQRTCWNTRLKFDKAFDCCTKSPCFCAQKKKKKKKKKKTISDKTRGAHVLVSRFLWRKQEMVPDID